MTKKKPCRICKRWFQPNRRVGNRQKVCSDPKCQRERQRRNCEDWRRRNPDYDREDRLRRRLNREAKEGGLSGGNSLYRELNESAARKLVGLEVFVFVDEIGRHLIGETR